MSTAVILQEHKIRPSAQRLAVYDYLRSVKTHPSVDTIYQALLPGNPGLSRTTIYNTLELLAQNGLVLTLDFGEGFLRYDADITPHSHFQCEKCGAVIDIMDTPKGCEQMVPKDCTLTSAALYLRGKCPDCK